MKKVDREDWKGQNRFFFQGKFMTGSSKDNVTLCLAYGGMTLFLIAYSLIISEYLINTSGFFFALIGYVLYFLGGYYMLKTTFTEPGVLPRGTLESPEEAMNAGIQLDLENCHQHAPLVKLDNSADSATDRILEISTKKEESLPNISLYKYRYCTTCKIMRPPKASHCSDCDNCVQNFDHHCFFVGNCIGRRNHKYFFLFLFYATLFCVYTSCVGVIAFCSVLSQNPELKLRLQNQFGYWIPASVFILTALICCQPRYCSGVKYTFLGLGTLIAALGLIIAASGLKLHFYEMPSALLGYIVVLSPFSIWIMSNFGGNLWGVSVGLTFKEKVVIEREVLDYGRRQGMFNITLSEKISNIREFFAREEVESYIRGVY